MAEQVEQAITVKFNVGGKLYEVSKSLLERFPDTLLAKKALEAGVATTPIFIERDPDRFAFCLDYMRDGGKLNLPAMISKASMLQDLGFFGFDDVDESLINDEASQKDSFVRHNDLVRKAHQRVATMWQKVADLKEKSRCEEAALMYFHKCAESFENEVTVNVPFEDSEKTTVPKIDRGKHFRECCSKLGIEVLEVADGSVRFRKLSGPSPPANTNCNVTEDDLFVSVVDFNLFGGEGGDY